MYTCTNTTCTCTQYLVVAYFEVVAVKGQGATDQSIQDDTQTPHIHLGTVVLLPLEELGSGVRRTATECVQFITRGELVTETKVSNLDVHVGIKQKVLSL